MHRILDRPLPQGWDNQLGRSLGLMATVEKRTAREALSAGLGADVRLNTATYWRVALGNITTYAAGGLAVVIGKDLPVVSPPPPSTGDKPNGDAAPALPVATSCLARWAQCSAFGAVEVRLVAYSVFLDGRLFHDDTAIHPRRIVSDVMLGTRLDFPTTRSARHGPWFVQLKLTRRSPEFRSSISVPWHRVAALTVDTEF